MIDGLGFYCCSGKHTCIIGIFKGPNNVEDHVHFQGRINDECIINVISNVWYRSSCESAVSCAFIVNPWVFF